MSEGRDLGVRNDKDSVVGVGDDFVSNALTALQAWPLTKSSLESWSLTKVMMKNLSMALIRP